MLTKTVFLMQAQIWHDIFTKQGGAGVKSKGRVAQIARLKEKILQELAATC